MLLVIDNYDSFTYNLVQYFGELNAKPITVRNDEITIGKIKKLSPDQILISPGPCTPKEAGISREVLQEFSGKIPILGVCLGHQAIGDVFGGKVVPAKRAMHGKISLVHHNNDPIFNGVSNPFKATRYHSLLVEKRSLPKILEITAWTADGEIMGLKHKKHSTWGLQFHPESIMTESGMRMVKNFLELSK